ncbi:phosphoheptose isomerase [Brackiella oedipodis]|uniref:phosphoheptose isomerase n=1 Tax=Brackiella oedipodis TaxID=124225 RepID=UPI00048FC648|nr:phosphoheptose isomerase [Brackiella oedipodis]
MDSQQRIQTHFEDHIAVATRTLELLAQPLATAGSLLTSVIANNRKVLACGNGGSAADAQHFIAELVGRFENERFALPGVALTTDTSILTAVGNDYGFDQIFSRQVQALGQAGDLLVALSTSGNSENVIQAIEAAHAADMHVIALTGRDGGQIGTLLQNDDVHLCIPDQRTMRIQEMHILFLHIICDLLDASIFGDS